MKIIATLAAGALAATSFAAAPAAEAQRYGYQDRGGWHGDRGGWRGDRGGWRGNRGGWRDGRGWRGGPRYYRGGYGGGWRGGPRYYRGGYGGGWRGGYGRPRVVCRIQRGYYGPVRRCFRAW